MSFEAERATYERHKADLLAYEGQYAVIKGSEVTAPLPTYDEALREGYETHGLSGFMVQKIEAVETVHRLPR